MSNNKQEIIKRIEEITEEVGLTSNSVSGTISLRDLTDQILQKLISTNSGDINGKVLDIFNKIQTIYNWSSNTDTKTNQIYTWFSNIYNELNSTSTSYMKGKINAIYNNMSSGGGGIKSVQHGVVIGDGSKVMTITHSYVNTNKSFVIIEGVAYGNNGGIIVVKTKSARNFTITPSYTRGGSFPTDYNFSWQLVEFY